MRTAQINRKTAETDIRLTLNLDGTGVSHVDTGCGFLNHMLELFARHGRFDLTVTCAGDMDVDAHPTAEDIAIDTFSDLVVHKNRYNFKVSLKTYLFMVGRSRALDYLRRNRKVDITSISEVAEISDDEAILEDMVLADERKRAVSGAIGQLPQDMREAVHLVYFEGLSYDEAAKVMKKNRKQVDNLLYRAKKELREILGEEGKLLL
jgi:RNA polymerase sigma-70 factor (ECF subfamily)